MVENEFQLPAFPELRPRIGVKFRPSATLRLQEHAAIQPRHGRRCGPVFQIFIWNLFSSA